MTILDAKCRLFALMVAVRASRQVVQKRRDELDRAHRDLIRDKRWDEVHRVKAEIDETNHVIVMINDALGDGK